RQPGGVQDLVGVGVADAAEDVRVGERALERVVLASQRGGELVQVAGEDLHAARVVPGQCFAAVQDVEGGALLGAGLGQGERAGGEAKSGQADLGGHLGVGRFPVQPARDHQVQHEVQVIVETPNDA